MDRERLRQVIAQELPRLRAIRHDLHRHPELGYQERRTAGVVARELAALGIEHVTGLAGGTGVVGFIPGTGEAGSPCVALRADMDALAIEERTGKPYASVVPGTMHACGHDGHTTILLGAAAAIAKMPHRPNAVLLVFQPAEEGGAGADRLCREGVLDGRVIGTRARIIFGLHGWPMQPLGTVASKPGPLLASTDEFEAEVRGTGAHAAYPHLSRDPVLAMARCIEGVQMIVSRNVSPIDSVVVTVATARAGTAQNVIPEHARFGGTVRALRSETRSLARERLEQIVTLTARAHGCEAAVEWREGYPVTSNDAAATEVFFRVARGALGEPNVSLIEHPTMGGEDFSYYGQRVPACFFTLGLCPAGRTGYPTLHQPDFDFNDDALGVGIETMCALALDH
ncbi:MAG: amidohydrolase [Phycisphaerae bacterium]|nr:amidohydrolase [Phycisphaerae bacterium]